MPVSLRFAGALLAAWLLGQPRLPGADVEVDPVIVTGVAPAGAGSLISPSFEATRERLLSLPAAATVEDRAGFDRGRGAYLEDFLRYQPGLIIQSSRGSEDDKVSIRGSGVQNDDLSGLAILVDGIPLNQADGEAYLRDVDLQSVRYAEVYRGADALRFGGVDLGGAINLVTVTGRDASPFAARISFGSHGFYEQQTSSGFAAGRGDFYAAAANHFLDGYSDHSAENAQKLSLNLGTKIGANAENRLYFFSGRLEQDNPSGLTKEQLEDHPRQTDPQSIAQNWSTRWNYFRLMDRFVFKKDDSQFLLALSYNHRTALEREEYAEDFRRGATRYSSDDYAADLSFESTADFLGGRNRLTLGLIPTFEAETDRSFADETRRLGRLLFSDRTRYLNLPVYLENQHYFGKRFSLLSGFQGVFADRVFRDTFKSPTLGDQSHRDHFFAFNPKVGLAYEWVPRSLVYLNASRSFQPPSFDASLGIREGVDGGRVFNELHSQGAITLEAGTRGEYRGIQWDVALYRSWVKDELLDQNNAQGQPLGTVNAPHTIHQGIEAALQVELLHGLLAGGAPPTGGGGKDPKGTAPSAGGDRLVFEQSDTYSDFRFDDSPVYGRNRIAGTPVNLCKAELRYEHPAGFYLGANMEWSSVKYPVDEANSLFADPYALLGARLGYRTRKGFQVDFEVKNLTGQVYAATVEPLGDARTSDDSASFRPGAGRAFYGGVSWIW